MHVLTKPMSWAWNSRKESVPKAATGSDVIHPVIHPVVYYYYRIVFPLIRFLE